jgi:flavorubredoxin
MNSREIKPGVSYLGAIDWDRRLFDSLIPLPDGTTYNAYLVEGTDKTVLIDTVDPPMTDVLMMQLADVPRIDYIVSNHAEPDHSGAIPDVLRSYPQATLLCSKRAVEVLVETLAIASDRIRVVEDGEKLELGGKTLEFLYTPWVHWPETMVTYLEQDRILFSCDLFGSHIASSDRFVVDEARVYEAAKRYFAEIMMPFRNHIRRHLDRLADYEIDIIAPSHGSIYPEPSLIVDAYREWAADAPKNLVALPFVSMHSSTRKMVDCLVDELMARGVGVERFDLTTADLGKLATALVDAATIVIGTPTVLGGPHPSAAYAAFLANALRPKAKFVSIIGSYGWGGRAVEVLAGMIPTIKAEVLDPLLTKGAPGSVDREGLARLADTIAAKHAELDA